MKSSKMQFANSGCHYYRVYLCFDPCRTTELAIVHRNPTDPYQGSSYNVHCHLILEVYQRVFKATTTDASALHASSSKSRMYYGYLSNKPITSQSPLPHQKMLFLQITQKIIAMEKDNKASVAKTNILKW